MKRFLTWFSNRSGATAIEYGLVAASIALAIVVSVFLFGDQLYATYFEDLPGALDGP